MKNARSIVVSVAVVAAGLVALATPAAAVPGPHLSTLITFTGNGGYSADGLGQIDGTGGLIQADVPSGSTVVHAYLYGSYFVTDPTATDLTINFDGTSVVLTAIAQHSVFLTTARADVTTQVSTKVGSGGGITNFAVNTDPSDLDGVGLVVIYSNPGSPAATITIVDGGANPEGDSATFSFPPFPAGGSAQMSLGIGFSYQGGTGAGTHICGTGSNQSSEVDVTIAGTRLTSCAGNYDDGFGQNGGLITVGGVADSTNNPADPSQHPADGTTPRGEDDELYDLSSLIATGDIGVTINTKNPSKDDNLFLAVVSTSTTAAADLSITKSDTATGYGPDPVSSGQVVAYKVSVTNNGPNTATGIQVTDTVTSGETIVGASGTNWSCFFESSTATCTRASGFESLASGATAEPITIQVQAPTTSTQTTINDTATVSGNESDPNTENNTDTEPTTVNPNTDSNSASGFVPPGGTIQTCQNTSSSDDTCSAITLPNTGNGAVITITEQPGATSKICNGPCSNQTTTYSITCAPATPCYTDINNPPKVILRYRTPGTSTKADMYFFKSGKVTKIPDCRKNGIANPNPCVSARKRLGFGTNDLQVQVLVTSDDPTIGKR